MSMSQISIESSNNFIEEKLSIDSSSIFLSSSFLLKSIIMEQQMEQEQQQKPYNNLDYISISGRNTIKDLSNGEKNKKSFLRHPV